MQGILWKWTNYLSGWQPRWFVLDNGVLSYYKSQEDVNNGCKGSLQMAVCDIAVHNTDHTRLDLIIPGEQHFYVKASTPHERQRWLVAMGTCKASLASGRPAEESGEISPDIVRTKKSELRLYCDLLMQQVHSVKSSVQESRPDVKKLDEATSLLSATCDTFIKSLEDCMKIANASIAYEMERSHQQITDSALPNMSLKLPQKKGDKLSSSSRVHGNPKVTKSASNSSLHSPRQRTTSENSYHSDHSLSGHSSDTSRDRLEMSDTNNSSSRLSRSQGSYDQPITNSVTSYSMGAVPKSNNYLQNTTQSVGTNVNKPTHERNSEHSSPLFENGGPGTNLDKSSVKSLSSTSVNSEEEFKDAVDAKIPTFFSTMTPSFMDIKLEKDGGIPTQPFLASCRSLVPIFDKFNATAFAPVKMDFQGNIRKIQQKHSTNSDHFSTLQKMVQSEIQARQQHLSSSATVALLWMKRGLEFIREILREICEGQPDLSTAVNNAYGKTLKPFHGWVIRGVFAVAAKALPYKEDFVAQLHAQGHPEDGSIFLQSLMADIDNYGTALDVILNILNDFYKSHSLDIAEQI